MNALAVVDIARANCELNESDIDCNDDRLVASSADVLAADLLEYIKLMQSL